MGGQLEPMLSTKQESLCSKSVATRQNSLLNPPAVGSQRYRDIEVPLQHSLSLLLISSANGYITLAVAIRVVPRCEPLPKLLLRTLFQ
jgi:hypothetical protein